MDTTPSQAASDRRMKMGDGDWKWWASYNEELYNIGPCDSRESVIEEAKRNELGFYSDQGGKEFLQFYIIEGRHDEIDLSKFVNSDMFIEYISEAVEEEFGNPDSSTTLMEDISHEQERDLDALIMATVREWQTKHKIVIFPLIFSQTRNRECIKMAVDEVISTEERKGTSYVGLGRPKEHK
jgi:hypothetical protein